MNIKFSYLYRDGANYKQFNKIVFNNPTNLTLLEIEAAINAKLIDNQWFVAIDWGLPDLHFKEYTWDSAPFRHLGWCKHPGSEECGKYKRFCPQTWYCSERM